MCGTCVKNLLFLSRIILRFSAHCLSRYFANTNRLGHRPTHLALWHWQQMFLGIPQTTSSWDEASTITFFFNPSRLSSRPLMAASVRTRVVSWNDAAEMKLSVVNAALVIPSKTGFPSAGLPSFRNSLVLYVKHPFTNLTAWQERRYRRDPRSAPFCKHLPNDDLDMLIVDRHTLQPVHILNFINKYF